MEKTKKNVNHLFQRTEYSRFCEKQLKVRVFREHARRPTDDC